jgi:urease accessory protein
VSTRPARRDDQAWCTPAALPEEFLAHQGPIDGGLGVGAVGKTGVLDLALAPSDGMTRVVRQYQRAPLHVFRPIHLDPACPGMAFVYLQQQGDGIVQGDRHRVDIDCAPGSWVHVTTQSSTKIYGARQNYATQLVNLRAGADSVLEYLPDPVVPFRGSRFFQRTSVTVGTGATVILGETVLPGRIARGEMHEYDMYWAETEVRRTDGTLLFADVLRMGTGVGMHPKSPAMLGRRRNEVAASLYVVTDKAAPARPPDPAGSGPAPAEPAEPAELVTLLRAARTADREMLVGVSELPHGCGVVVRLLGPTSQTVGAAVRDVWNAARLALLGRPAPDLRKG